MRTAANIISIIFHPSFLPSLLMFILLWFAEKNLKLTQEGKRLVLFTTFFVFTGLLPVLNVIILKYFGFIRSLQMDERRDRNMPYITGMIYYAGLFYLIIGSDMPPFYMALVATGFIVIMVTYLINLRWKISAHMMGAGAFLGALLMYSIIHRQNLVPFVSLAFIIGGLLGFARLYLGKHSESQVYTGYFTGLAIAMLFIPITQLIIKSFLYR